MNSGAVPENKVAKNLYRYGAEWIGTDISSEQIEQAKRLAAEAGMNIRFETAAAEQIVFPAGSFDVLHYAALAVLKRKESIVSGGME